MWKCRILLESFQYPENSFLTLTYDEGNIPEDGQLKKSDLQKFFKRLRNRIGSFRYYAIGEYGPLQYRPHFHDVLFGVGIDKRPDCFLAWMKSSYVRCQLGKLEQGGADYISGYITEKIGTGDDPKLKRHLEKDLNPVFSISSRKGGGIGIGTIKQIAEEMKKRKLGIRDFQNVRIGGKEYPIGKYLTEKLIDLVGHDEDHRASLLFDYQKEMLDQYEVGDIYKEKVIEYKEQERISQYRRNKRFRKRMKGNLA